MVRGYRHVRIQKNIHLKMMKHRNSQTVRYMLLFPVIIACVPWVSFKNVVESQFPHLYNGNT